MPRLVSRPCLDPLSPADRQKLAALLFLGRARRHLIDAGKQLSGTHAGANFDGLLAAVEARIDRIRLHGLGPVESDEEEPLAVYVDPVMLAYGVDGGCSPVYVTPEGYPVVPE